MGPALQPLSPHRPRRIADLRRHRPRRALLAQSSPSEAVKVSDLVLAVTGVALLGGLCLVLAGNLLAL